MILSNSAKENRCKAWMFILESEPVNLPISEKFKEYLPDDIIKEIRQQYEIMRMRGENYGK